jgi:hypothetical protein
MKILIPFIILASFYGIKLNAQAGLVVRSQLQLAIDAEAYWVGPQAGVGAGLQWPSGWGVMSEYYGFKDKVNLVDGNWYEKGFFRQQTIALMGSYNFGKSKNRGFYVMGGLAYQSRKSDFENPFGPCPVNMDYFLPAFEFGRRWPVSNKGYGIAASIKFTGPITYNSEPHIELLEIPESNVQYPYYVGESSTLEILTQLSIGIVVDRVFPKNAAKKVSSKN